MILSKYTIVDLKTGAIHLKVDLIYFDLYSRPEMGGKKGIMVQFRRDHSWKRGCFELSATNKIFTAVFAA